MNGPGRVPPESAAGDVRPVPGGVCAVAGVTAAGVAAGLKPSRAPDVALVDAGRPVPAAAVQTRNRVRAAPVEVTAAHLRTGRARAVLLNAGSANACTGPDGLATARLSTEEAAAALGCAAGDVLVCSTGVIGRPLDGPAFFRGIRAAAAGLADDGGEAAARAIMTTDTHPKQAAVEATDEQGVCRVGGMAKGSGMIRPELATMLCVVTTDAPVASPVLADLLRRGVETSFNRISVDGCMSTNDAVIVLATGDAPRAPGVGTFRRALDAVLATLAEQIVRDGEGASRIARIRVTGADDTATAVALARRVADSALVRTALAGGDPNWGRILAAMGAGPEHFVPERVSVAMGPPGRPGVTVCRFGMATSYDEGQAAAAVAGDEVVVAIDLGGASGADGHAEVLTCDLTHGYVTINAEYTT